ncbi:MAG: glucosidase, partial [Chloroflexi bacterium]|nr:glucosidase [Chloroflexota bacterium]
MSLSAEHIRLAEYRERTSNWKEWGPYLSERAWGTVREDYSESGAAWDYFPHDHARSRAYRWNEDGLAGISDRSQFLCFSVALWNDQDPILKERLFGLTGPEGNHGEDVKEAYFYLDNTPTHSYMKMLYKYPQAAFPYADLVEENRRRNVHEAEYELLDTGMFAGNRYFDVFVEYAKAGQDDILARIEVVNRGPDAAECSVLPTLWFRNTWSWGYPNGPMGYASGKPRLSQAVDRPGIRTIAADHAVLGHYTLYVGGSPDLLFTENETNLERLFNVPNPSPFVKDAFHRYLIQGEKSAINPKQEGTKSAAHYRLALAPGASATLRLRLSRDDGAAPLPPQSGGKPDLSPPRIGGRGAEHTHPFGDFDALFAKRIAEADEFYAEIQPPTLTDDARRVQRQALAGMLWSKQLYYYDVQQWLRGDPAGPPPPAARREGRNRDWEHLNNFDVISMPDKWEYPWYATWDLAFHCIPLAALDADFAKRQLDLIGREWYMHPNGAFPAYEWAFGDVNPPVHAWAALRVYQIEKNQTGKPDRAFLEGIFHKLLL